MLKLLTDQLVFLIHREWLSVHVPVLFSDIYAFFILSSQNRILFTVCIIHVSTEFKNYLVSFIISWFQLFKVYVRANKEIKNDSTLTARASEINRHLEQGIYLPVSFTCGTLHVNHLSYELCWLWIHMFWLHLVTSVM